MEVNLLQLENKKIRSEVIKEYLKDKNYKGVVCFSCGNASRELKNVGLNVIDISPTGDLIPNKWYKPSEVYEIFKDYFDATSGHLSIELMQLIGEAYKNILGELPKINYIPSGSGETLVCLKLAYPNKDFIAVYNLDKATEYNENATLNNLVKILAKGIIDMKGINND